jgi:hypothetical protein
VPTNNNNNNNNNNNFAIYIWNNNNNILQFDMILNNEASVVESFFQIFSMAPNIFSEFSIIPKSN